MNILNMIGVEVIREKISQFRRNKKDALLHDSEIHGADQNIELSKSQSELLKAQARIQELYDFSPFGYATFSRAGSVVNLNVTLAGYLGYERDQILNTPFVCWLARGQSTLYMQHLNQVFLTHEKQVVQLALKEVTGNTRIVRLETVVIESESGMPRYCKSGVVDVTHEVRNGESLEHEVTQRRDDEKEERYRLLFSCVNEAIFLYDAGTRCVLDANQAAMILYGYSMDEFKKLQVQDLFAGADSNSPECEGGLESVYGPLPRATFHKSRSGELLPVEVSMGSYILNGREVVLVVAHGLQEPLAAETRLKLAAEVFDCASEAIMVADSNFRIVMVNPAFTTITGYESDEAAGRDSRKILAYNFDFDAFSEMGFLSEKYLQCQHEVLHRHKLGGEYYARESFSSVRDADGSVAYYICIFSDISQLKKAEAKSLYIAHHDVLTQLPNRLLFGARLDQSLQLAKRHGAHLALLFLDLDRFKSVNDTMGHASGDVLLREIAIRIGACVREQDTVARFGGDEFTVLLSEIRHEQEAANIAEKILQAVSQPVSVAGQEITVSTSIGIGLYPRDAKNASDLIKAADMAMYCAKGRGRQRFEFYTHELTARSEERLDMERVIRDNLAAGNFFLCYQPQFDLLSGKLSGVEALLRWRSATGEISTPEKIIAIAEESRLILDLDAWVLRAACEQAAHWHRIGMPCLKTAINFSAASLIRDGFVEKVKRALYDFSLPAEWIELEVTENVLQSGEQAVKELIALKNLGVALAIDNFGTGYSSLSSLKILPIDRIKIDKSLIIDVPASQSNAGITQAIITMGHNLNIKVIAEGVENDSQWQFLRSFGCDEVQGFRFGMPEAASNIPYYVDRKISLQSISEPPNYM